MPQQFARLQTNFTGGIFSPALRARSDLVRYQNGVKDLLNYIVQVQGGIYRRSGYRYVAETKDSSKKARLLRFQFSQTQAYVIEAGDLYFRFYKDEGRITSTKSITGAVDNGAGLIRITAATHGYQSLNTVTISSVGGVSAATGTWVITVIDANNFDLVGSVFSGTYTSGGSAVAIVEVATPYVEADLYKLKTAQSADTMYIAHSSYAPRTLTRSSHTAWTVSTFAFIDGPFLAENVTATILNYDGSTGVTADVAGTFVASDVGRWIRIYKEADDAWGIFKITAFTDSQTVVVDNYDDVIGSANATRWMLGAWSTSTGWPSCVTFHENRLWWANTTTQPSTMWGSVSFQYTDYRPSAGAAGEVLDTHAITADISANEGDTIQWMRSGQYLLVGTFSAVYVVRPIVATEALSPTNRQAVFQEAIGSSTTVEGERVGNGVLFVKRSGRMIYSLGYDYTVDSQAATPRTLLCPALFYEHTGVYATSWQADPDGVFWQAMGDGQMLGMTYEVKQDVFAFHRHVHGGAFGSGGAVIDSVVSIPLTDVSEDQNWIIVKQTINSTTKRYVEFGEQKFRVEAGDVANDAFFVDSGLTYNGSAATVITGLSHLEGKSVQVNADGVSVGPHTVASGQITLATAASVVHVGLAYDTYAITLPPEGGKRGESAQGAMKRVSHIVLMVKDSYHLLVGPTVDEAVSAPEFPDDDTTLLTDTLKIKIDGRYDRTGVFAWKQDLPYPSEVLGVVTLEVVS